MLNNNDCHKYVYLAHSLKFPFFGIMDRREVLRSLLLSGLGFSLNVPFSMVWRDTTKLTVDEDLSAITEVIIPETDTPGAIEAGVPEFIMSAIYKTGEPGYAEKFLDGLRSFTEKYRAENESAFHDLGNEDKQSILSALAESGDEFFKSVRIWTIIGYFTSEAGMTQALHYDPIPREYLPCVDVTSETRGEATYF